jgi:hypothetical protein
MSKYIEESAVEPITESFTHSQGTPQLEVQEVPSEVAPPLPDNSYEGDANSQPVLWQPTEPQFTKAIATYYGVSRKSVQEWFQKIKAVCPWFTEADLKLPDGRYSLLCIGLMGDYRTSGLPLEVWKAKVWEQNPDLVAAYQASQQPQPTQNPVQAQQGQVTLYQRSEMVQRLLEQRRLPQYDHTTPDENPVILALQEFLTQTESQNVDSKARLEQFTKSTVDGQTVCEALEELKAIQEGEAAADKLFFLREQAKQRRLQELQLSVLGKPAASEAAG